VKWRAVEAGTFGLQLKIERKRYYSTYGVRYHRYKNLSCTLPCIQMAWVLWLFECRKNLHRYHHSSDGVL